MDYYKIPVTDGQTIKVDMTSKIVFKCGLAMYDDYEQPVDDAEFTRAESHVSVSWTFDYQGFCYFALGTGNRQGGVYSLVITSSGGMGEIPPQGSSDDGDSGFNIPGYPTWSIMIGIFVSALFLGFRSRISSNRYFQSYTKASTVWK